MKRRTAALTAGAAFFAALLAHEGFRSRPYRDSGGVPTIGIGSTQYPDGRRVSMSDKPVSKAEAVAIAKAHIGKDEAAFRGSLPNVRLTQGEYDLYLDFVYQYGQAAWQRSSMRRHLLAENHVQACHALLKYRFVGKRDCALAANNCRGVYRRQLERHKKCLAENA